MTIGSAGTARRPPSGIPSEIRFSFAIVPNRRQSKVTIAALDAPVLTRDGYLPRWILPHFRTSLSSLLAYANRIRKTNFVVVSCVL